MPYTERTYQLLGKAYADSGSVSTVCTYDGVETHNGAIPTMNAVAPVQNIVEEPLCSFTRPLTEYNVTKTFTMTVTGGTVFVSGLAANCTDPTAFADFNKVCTPLPEVKTNVRLDGTLIDAVEADDGWHYMVPDGSTIEIDWVIPKPAMGVPGHKGGV